MISAKANKIFQQVIADYHIHDKIDHPIENPYDKDSFEHLLYLKAWIDTAQWHMEDVIRDPEIDADRGLYWKRRIDRQNQDRTDKVEFIDSYYLHLYREVSPLPEAKINTESPAWAIDRLSILALKIFHMEVETQRKDVTSDHLKTCQDKLDILLEQRTDLSQSIDELLQDIAQGR